MSAFVGIQIVRVPNSFHQITIADKEATINAEWIIQFHYWEIGLFVYNCKNLFKPSAILRMHWALIAARWRERFSNWFRFNFQVFTEICTQKRFDDRFEVSIVRRTFAQKIYVWMLCIHPCALSALSLSALSLRSPSALSLSARMCGCVCEWASARLTFRFFRKFVCTVKPYENKQLTGAKKRVSEW